jgi:Fructose-bisphosphate aldolase class-I
MPRALAILALSFRDGVRVYISAQSMASWAGDGDPAHTATGERAFPGPTTPPWPRSLSAMRRWASCGLRLSGPSRKTSTGRSSRRRRSAQGDAARRHLSWRPVQNAGRAACPLSGSLAVGSYADRPAARALWEHRVALEGLLLKWNMVLPGTVSAGQAPVDEVAEATVRCLLRSVPMAVPGIVCLSGGQADELASAHLNAINRLPGPLPWPLSFSYARALQTAPLRAWGGGPARVGDAQRAFRHRARCNSAARSGAYTPELERSAA